MVSEKTIIGEFKKVGSVIQGPDDTLYIVINGVATRLIEAGDKIVGQTIREIRQSQEFTTREGTKAFDTSLSQLSRVEAGQQSPTLKTLRRIADGLGHELRISLFPH